MNVPLPDGTIVRNVPNGMTMAELYAKLKANGYDIAKLSGATKPGVNIVQELKDAQIAYDKAQPEGGFWPNLGAGMNKTIQGVKQLFGHGETDAQTEERRKLDDRLAESTPLGGLTQLGGETIMSALPAMGASSMTAKGLTMLPKVGSVLSDLGGVGGRVLNVGGIGRGALEGGFTGALNPVTDDESRGLNALIGMVGGAAVPAALTVGNALRKTLNKSNAPNRAAKIFEDQIGPNNVHEINFRLDTQPAPALPLSTAARAENPSLASLERGARGRNTNDMGYTQSKAVAEKAWNGVRGATTQADDLANRVADREATIQLSKEHLDKFNKPRALGRAQGIVANTAEELRNTTVLRQNPEINNIVSQTETLLSHPERTAGDYASQYWRLTDLSNGPNVSAEGRGAILKLRDSVQKAADEASGGTNQFTDMVERYKVDQAHVDTAQASKGVREAFVDPHGVVKGSDVFGDTPSITAAMLRKSMVKNGSNAYGDMLEPPTRSALKDLEGELTRHEMHLSRNSPGLSQLEINNPLSVISSGRDNPFNYFPLVKGGANWLFSGARKATTEAADKAMMDPAVWQKMMADYAASKSPLTAQEYMSRALRQSTVMPGNALATQIGE